MACTQSMNIKSHPPPPPTPPQNANSGHLLYAFNVCSICLDFSGYTPNVKCHSDPSATEAVTLSQSLYPITTIKTDCVMTPPRGAGKKKGEKTIVMPF